MLVAKGYGSLIGRLENPGEGRRPSKVFEFYDVAREARVPWMGEPMLMADKLNAGIAEMHASSELLFHLWQAVRTQDQLSGHEVARLPSQTHQLMGEVMQQSVDIKNDGQLLIRAANLRQLQEQPGQSPKRMRMADKKLQRPGVFDELKWIASHPGQQAEKIGEKIPALREKLAELKMRIQEDPPIAGANELERHALAVQAKEALLEVVIPGLDKHLERLEMQIPALAEAIHPPSKPVASGLAAVKSEGSASVELGQRELLGMRKREENNGQGHHC